MPNSFFIIIIPIIALIISFVSTRGTLSDLKYKKQWWKIITVRGWIVVGLTGLIVGLLCWQNKISIKENNAKDEAIRKQRESSENIITSKVDSNRKVLFSDLSEALAKQNLQFDSSQKKLEKLIIDSSKRVTNIISESEPSLMLNTNPVTLDSSNGNYRYFSINIKAFKGEVYNANLHLKVIKESNKELSLFKINPDVGIENERLTEGMRTFIPVNLYASRGTILYFYVFGSYTNSTNKKRIPFDEICMFDLNDFVSAFLTAEPNRKVRKFLNEKNSVR